MTGVAGNGNNYSDISYLQFNKSRIFRWFERIAGILSWPILWPLAMLARMSDILFRSFSELLSIVPYLFGIIVRYEFYRFALRSVGENVQFEFGVIFVEKDVTIGSHVLIGRYCIIHHCDFGDYVLIGERCTFLSGSRQHTFDRTDVPMALQGGRKKKITVGTDCWIGSHAVVMDDVGNGAIVAAGSIVTKAVAVREIVAGNPAKPVSVRDDRNARST